MHAFVRGHECNSSRQKFKPREEPRSVTFLYLYTDASDNVTLHSQPEPSGPRRSGSSAELEMFVFDTAAPHHSKRTVYTLQSERDKTRPVVDP